jgi:hypothetical protein
MQGNIDTPGDEMLSYCLPPDEMSDEWLEENKDRIVLLEEKK